MSEPLSLDEGFGRPVARATDPGTSWAAAAFTEPRAGTNRALALRLLREHPDGLTDYELADLSGLQQNSIGKRRGELRDAGLVQDSGRRRRAPSGAAAIVWVATRDDDPLLGPCRRCGFTYAEHPGGFCPDQVGTDGMVAVGTAAEFEEDW